ncbi:hypothetical protein TSUD_259210 [Trifolium subterraneum]|uniref:Uncharacterized protein n=1 Tax=Trifolium subterraneum TaxID=3900 RepID=A0A2Z6MTY8_TRISU|nr:hypothetical protein TSUD_259210 [Trifolium subterraneum]
MPMSMKSDTLFRGFKRPKPDTRFRGSKRPRPATFFREFKLKPAPCPYDVVPSSYDSELAGGVPILPLCITKYNRPILIRFSQLALEFYIKNQEGSGVDANFKFHDLVKCTYWIDYRPRRHLCESHRRSPTRYYITFKAKAKGDPSSSADIIIFQAKISIDEEDEDNLPVVEECRIKI